ncbi:hypothetical protein EG831_06425 [bacterium]|nr:hypothetical protein [bacterium]
MDTFARNTGIIGFLLAGLALAMLATAIALKVKRRIRLGGLFNSGIAAVVLAALAAAFIFLSLFARTYNIMSRDTRIGTVSAVSNGTIMYLHYVDEANRRTHGFQLSGDQWMIEGYILRWKPFLRFLGARPYYRVTRFSGRWESPYSTTVTNHQIWTEPGHWRWLLRHGQKFPLIDAVQGIAAFQYPDSGAYGVYVSDAGFVLKKQ